MIHLLLYNGYSISESKKGRNSVVNRHKIWEDVYIFGGTNITHPSDCMMYFIGSEELVLMDSGAGESFDRIWGNIQNLGLYPEKKVAVIATHAHIDHIGTLHQFWERFWAQVIAHELEVNAIETGKGTGAEYYGVTYHPCKVDIILSKEEEMLSIGDFELKVVYISGHTSGGVAIHVNIGKRMLFGQNIHGSCFLKASNTIQAKLSLQKLIDLNADILCEGHFGIYQPASEVKCYIEGYLYS